MFFDVFIYIEHLKFQWKNSLEKGSILQPVGLPIGFL